MIKYTTEYLSENANTTLVALGDAAQKVHCKKAVHGKHAIGLTWKQLRAAHFKNYFGIKSHFAAMFVFEDYASKTIDGQTYKSGKLYIADKTGLLTECVEPENVEYIAKRLKAIKNFDKSIVKMAEAVEAV